MNERNEQFCSKRLLFVLEGLVRFSCRVQAGWLTKQVALVGYNYDMAISLKWEH